MGPAAANALPLLTPDLHKRHGPGRGTAHTPIDQAYGVSLAECLQTHSTMCDSKPDLWKMEEGTLHPDPAEEQSTENSMNTRWHSELRAMKTVVAGAVGANCGEANLTHCGPPMGPC